MPHHTHSFGASNDVVREYASSVVRLLSIFPQQHSLRTLLFPCSHPRVPEGGERSWTALPYIWV